VPWDRHAKVEELLGVHWHVVVGETVDEGSEPDRLIEHERAVRPDDRRDDDGARFTAELS